VILQMDWQGDPSRQPQQENCPMGDQGDHNGE
jgi:hypothetical protein